MTSHPLDDLVQAKRAGVALGMTSVCSAHPTVLEATLRHGASHNHIVLVEATCNQVNQDGGYTGLTAAAFRTQVMGLAEQAGLPPERLLLGGDHLGPNPWRKSSAEVAMAKAEALVRDFVAAGYTKIHLDASMRCADDAPGALPPGDVAQRTARLVVAAESEAPDDDARSRLRYVIGTEVPVPGGESAGHEGIHVSTSQSVEETIAVTRQAFASSGQTRAWGRVRAVVAQPGVEFSDTQLFDYRPVAARHLVDVIEGHPDLVFEAHSTDYQTVYALSRLVDDHFAVLKVGPGLTFAYREGVFALAHIEDELLGDDASHVREVLDKAMLDDAASWQDFYSGDPDRVARSRGFSRSDRCRYYWPVPPVAAAVEAMVANLRTTGMPEELVSQYLPDQYRQVRNGEITLDPSSMLRSKVTAVLDDYLVATDRS
ncbi:MAG: class II D-tagatose-bisphosphate aldolase, non-catalytic subunit [Actinomycetes bacterium]